MTSSPTRQGLRVTPTNGLGVTSAIRLAPSPVRCLTKEQAAVYLGIGVTLLLQLGPLPIKLGRRSVWDVVDLDRWLMAVRAFAMNNPFVE